MMQSNSNVVSKPCIKEGFKILGWGNGVSVFFLMMSFWWEIHIRVTCSHHLPLVDLRISISRNFFFVENLAKLHIIPPPPPPECQCALLRGILDPPLLAAKKKNFYRSEKFRYILHNQIQHRQIALKSANDHTWRAVVHGDHYMRGIFLGLE